MTASEYIVVSIIIIALVAFYTGFFSNAAIIKRKLKKATGVKISMFMEGEVAKVVGQLKYINPPLIAPLSKRKCSYYHIIVEQRVSTGKSSYWDTIIEEEKAQDVVIKDGNSYAFIETTLIKSHLIPDQHYSSGTFNDTTPELETFLARHDLKSVNFLGMNKTLRYSEGVLEEGEVVAVLGKGNWKRKAEVKLDIPTEKILVISKKDDEEGVYLSDDPITTKENPTQTGF
jgi:hypothetical protein